MLFTFVHNAAHRLGGEAHIVVAACGEVDADHHSGSKAVPGVGQDCAAIDDSVIFDTSSNAILRGHADVRGKAVAIFQSDRGHNGIVVGGVDGFSIRDLAAVCVQAVIDSIVFAAFNAGDGHSRRIIDVIRFCYPVGQCSVGDCDGTDGFIAIKCFFSPAVIEDGIAVENGFFCNLFTALFCGVPTVKRIIKRVGTIDHRELRHFSVAEKIHAHKTGFSGFGKFNIKVCSQKVDKIVCCQCRCRQQTDEHHAAEQNAQQSIGFLLHKDSPPCCSSGYMQ